MQTILVATDGSTCGQQAEDEGVKLAVATGARLVFLHAQPEVDPSHSQPGALSEETDESHSLLDRALAKAVEAGVYAESEIVEGSPGRETCCRYGAAVGLFRHKKRSLSHRTRSRRLATLRSQWRARDRRRCHSDADLHPRRSGVRRSR